MEKCAGCSIVLSEKRKDPATALLVAESYDPERKTSLRSVNTCSCKICVVAKLNGLDSLLASQKNKRKPGLPTTKIIPENVKIYVKCFTKIIRGSSNSASQCQYSHCVKVASFIEILIPTIIQGAASREKYLFEVLVTPLYQPKKSRGGKKGI